MREDSLKQKVMIALVIFAMIVGGVAVYLTLKQVSESQDVRSRAAEIEEIDRAQYAQ